MKYFINLIAIILIVAFTFWILNSSNSPNIVRARMKIGEYMDNVKEYLKIKKHNINIIYDRRSKRYSRPLVTVGRESLLKRYLPDVFKNFSRKDWDEFWSLIYEPVDEEQGKYIVKRYLTREEIKDILKSRFVVFSYLSDAYWNIFFDIIYGRM